MGIQAKLPLQFPYSEKEDRYFSVSIKNEILVERSIYQRPDKLLVMSDIGGNLEVLRKMLSAARVLDKKNHWTFDHGHLIIIGNCFEKGEQSVECLWFIYDLEEKAQRYGGRVHFILGNQEIMNLNGSWRYMHPRYASNVKKAGSAYLTLYDGNSEIWRWLKTKNVIEKIGELLFVHNGISPELLQFNYSLDVINRKARLHYTQAKHFFDDPFLHVLFDVNLSPFSYTGYCNEQEDTGLIAETLKCYDAQKIITGHTITDQIRYCWGRRIINVGTHHAGGNSQALLILRNNFYRLLPDGKRERIV